MNLPWEIIDKILIHINDLDLSIKLNRKYTSKNIIKYKHKKITNTLENLHLLSNGDYTFKHTPEFYDTPDFYDDLKSLNQNKDKNKINSLQEQNGNLLKLIIVDFDYFFNNLELVFFNPNKECVFDFIKNIKFTIGGQTVHDTTFDIKNYYKIFNQLFNKNITHKNGFTYLPLHFIKKNGLLYNPIYQKAEIFITTKRQICNLSIQGNKYNKNVQQEITNQIIYKCQVIEKITIINNKIIETIDSWSSIRHYEWEKEKKRLLSINNPDPTKISIILYTNYLSQLLYLTCKNVNNIDRISMIIYGKIIFDETLLSINTINENLGYDFNGIPVIIFSKIFDRYSNTTLNFSRLSDVKLVITQKTFDKNEDYKIYNVYNSILSGTDLMLGNYDLFC